MSSCWSLQAPRPGYYQATIRVPGARKRAVTLGSLTPEAAAQAVAILNEAGTRLLEFSNEEIRRWALDPEAREGMTAPGQRDVSQLTLGQFVEEFYRDEIFHKEVVAEGTWRREKLHLERFLEEFRDVRLSDLTAARWARYLAGRRHLAGNSRRLEQIAFLRILKRAHELGALGQVPRLPKIPGANRRVTAIKPLTADQVNALLDHAPTPMHRAMFAAGFSLGLRPGELPTLRWEDVNWRKRQLLVRGTKTERSNAVIPLTDRAYMELEHWWNENGEPSLGLMFLWGGKPIRSFKKALQSAAKGAGIEDKLRPNVMRHTFITLAALSNPPVPIPVVMAITRHADSKMIAEVYTRAGALTMTAGLQNFPL